MITSALKEFKPLKHRMEKVSTNSKVTYINDSKSTNIYSTISAIDTFKKNIILILGGYSNERIKKKLIIKTIKINSIKQIVCYGEIGHYLVSIINNIKPIKYYKNFKYAILNSIKIAKENDIVLLSPAFKSFDQFKNYEERGNEFKKIISEYYQ